MYIVYTCDCLCQNRFSVHLTQCSMRALKQPHFLLNDVITPPNRWERLHQRLPHGAILARREAVRNWRRHKRSAPADYRPSFQRHVQVIRSTSRNRVDERRYSHPGALNGTIRCCCLFLNNCRTAFLFINPDVSYVKSFKDKGNVTSFMQMTMLSVSIFYIWFVTSTS